MDMDDEFEMESGGETLDLREHGRSALQLAAWRRIEEARERRQLRQALEDFDDYVV